MRVLVDSSTLYSAIAHAGRAAEVVAAVAERATLVVTGYTVEEMRRNLGAAFDGDARAEAFAALDAFVSGCEVRTVRDCVAHLPRAMKLVSAKDAPILACALLPDVEALLTSDKELLRVGAEGVRVVAPAEVGQLF